MSKVFNATYLRIYRVGRRVLDCGAKVMLARVGNGVRVRYAKLPSHLRNQEKLLTTNKAEYISNLTKIVLARTFTNETKLN